MQLIHSLNNATALEKLDYRKDPKGPLNKNKKKKNDTSNLGMGNMM